MVGFRPIKQCEVFDVEVSSSARRLVSVGHGNGGDVVLVECGRTLRFQAELSKN